MCEPSNVNTTVNPILVSASEMARRANVPVPRWRKAIKAGIVKADATALHGRLQLFDLNRLEQIRHAITSEPKPML